MDTSGTVDPWSGKFCCGVQESFGVVDLDAAPAAAERWIAETFPADAPGAAARPVVDLFIAVGDAFDVVPLSLATISDKQRLTSAGFTISAFRYFDRRMGARSAGARPMPDNVITLVIGAERILVMYSHSFGDETVFYPKTRRLLLAICGQSLEGAVALTDTRPVTRRRIVAAAAGVVARSPRNAGRALAQAVCPDQRVSGRDDPLPRPDTTSFWLHMVTLERMEAVERMDGVARGLANAGQDVLDIPARKIPSVLLYCSILAELGTDPRIAHHVITDLRSYSSLLRGTGGNVLSHVPFRADWEVETPEQVAAEIRRRIRTGEPLLRHGAAQVLGGIPESVRPTGAVAPRGGALETTMSYFREPAGESRLNMAGSPASTFGLLETDHGMLSFNARERAGVADLTINHRGGLVSRSDVSRAVATVAARLGLRIVFENGADLRKRNAVTSHRDQPVDFGANVHDVVEP